MAETVVNRLGKSSTHEIPLSKQDGFGGACRTGGKIEGALVVVFQSDIDGRMRRPDDVLQGVDAFGSAPADAQVGADSGQLSAQGRYPAFIFLIEYKDRGLGYPRAVPNIV